MKTVILLILRVIFVAIYSIAVGLLTGWLWNKFLDRQMSKLVGRHHAHQHSTAA